MENWEKVIKRIYEKHEDEIKRRIRIFESYSKLSKEEKFIELCFCILVAGNSLQKTLFIWKNIGKDFLFLNERELKEKLKKLGYRFYNLRASFIIKNREKMDILEKIECSKQFREILVKNFYGIGYKEASHFLRNIGCKNLAIIDRHVLNFLKKFNLIKEIPKNLTRKKYLEIEDLLENMAIKINISLVELDFCIFYHETKNFPEK